MEKLKYKRVLFGVRGLLLTAVLFFNLPMMAESDWVVVFQNTYGEEQQIPMNEVGSFFALDDAFDFSILSTTGEVLAEGVLKVSFQKAIKKGDANGDEAVNAADIVEVVNAIKGSPSDKYTQKGGDANEDGTVNAADIETIVNMIMGN